MGRSSKKKIQFWRNHYLSWEKSGKTQTSYCKAEKISHSTFKYYLTKHNNSKKKAKEIATKRFVRVQPIHKEPLPLLKSKQESAGLYIHLNNKLKISVCDNFSEKTLEKVISILQGS